MLFEIVWFPAVSPSSNSQPISDLYLKIEFEAPVNAWMSKIPTNSNIGDDLSRDECQLVTSLGCSTTDVDVDSVWNDMQEFLHKRGEQGPAMQFPPYLKNASGQQLEFNQVVQQIAI